ncbi:hypothetical protein KRX51_07605 [Corynebacterium sp. TAE3-ERU12]|uniref:hypothetical protein n=1 Tax=Corynebacterium sp. TAE3-ERU12 TaxID=2849491 RepID=UPI001C486FDB|nr:hypothetical protein [Corynebacterium sp. TAE3-ERU12]MBV7295779.1 hypothetical protein [Corynebacterium sp. TAE3-ERU12]
MSNSDHSPHRDSHDRDVEKLGANSVELDDGTVVSWESWTLGEQEKNGETVTAPILRDGTAVAEYVRVGKQEAINSGGESWDVDQVDKARLIANLPDGRCFTAKAEDKGSVSRAKRLSVDFGTGTKADDSVVIVCESSQNYVLENTSGVKLGQFTGANHGVRHAEIQYDTPAGKDLPDEHKVFLSWVARHVLESRMISATWVLTLVLLLLIAYLTYIWML